MKLFSRKEWDTRINNNELVWKEDCPFCKSTWKEKKYIVKDTKYWSIRYNKFPYYCGKNHLLAVPKKHKEYTYELSLEELKDYKNVEIFIKKYYWNKQYFSLIRQTMWNRSVEHMHYHYLLWSIWYKEVDWNNYLKIKNT